MNTSHPSEGVSEEAAGEAAVERKQSSRQVSRSAAKVPAGRVTHGGAEIPTCSLPPAGSVKSAAALRLHGEGKMGDVTPRQHAAHSAGVDI